MRPDPAGGWFTASGASPTGPGPALRASPDAVCGAAPAGGMRPARPPGGGSPAAPLRLPAPQVRRASPPPASRFRPGESRRPSRRSDRCRLPPAGTGPSPRHGGRPPPQRQRLGRRGPFASAAPPALRGSPPLTPPSSSFSSLSASAPAPSDRRGQEFRERRRWGPERRGGSGPCSGGGRPRCPRRPRSRRVWCVGGGKVESAPGGGSSGGV